MSTDEKNIKKLNKPKVISIVKVNKPIKLMKLNEKSGNNENKNTNVVDNYVPLNDASNIQNIKENFKEVDMPKNSIKSLSDNIIISATSIEQNENKSKTLKSEKYEKTKEANVSKKNCMKSTKEKENKITIDKKKVKSVTIKSPNLDILKHKSRLYSSDTNTKKLNATNKKSISVTTKKNSKPIVGVMPCYKYKKVESKTPVKKTVIRDIIGSKIKPCINPGIEKTPDNLKFLEIDENIHVKSVISGKELAKPEYNSIMYTISKLNELKKQKIITDIEHLPASYKNLISGKISTALDFPLDEVIYKNLVDLSIDENQLPSRLTRSKDPEPRQKDIVPILSDFFTPVPIDEYCTPVSVKPRSSETIDYWNAFRISDQIYEWKHTLNHI